MLYNYKDIVKQLSTESEIIVHYMNIPLFMKTLIPKKDVTDFSIKREKIFEQHDFHITFLSDDEIYKVNEYKSLKKQIEWICGRFLVKNMVKQFVDSNVKLSNVKISYKKEGAPFLEQFKDITISISHSGDYAAVALCKNSKNIGIDIEKSEYLPTESFIRIVFTDKEIANINYNRKNRLISTQKRPEEIYSNETVIDDNIWYGHEIMRLWTIKEAFLKYIYKGFNEKLKSIEVLNNRLFYNGDEVTGIDINSFNIDNRYILSLIG